MTADKRKGYKVATKDGLFILNPGGSATLLYLIFGKH